jgi:hypothetical protein
VTIIVFSSKKTGQQANIIQIMNIGQQAGFLPDYIRRLPLRNSQPNYGFPSQL